MTFQTTFCAETLSTAKALLQITHYRFQKDFRKGLLFAAAAADDLALHIQCGAERVLTTVTREGAAATPWRSFAELETTLRAQLGAAQVIVLTGVCGTYAPDVEAILRLFPRRRRFYDVQDDLSYGARGLDYLKFLKRDFRWRRLCGHTVVLEQGMKCYYPGARHLDNASHIKSRRRAAAPVKVVYIGSIDHRVDLALLEALSEQTDIDILGSYHESAGAMPELEGLLHRSRRLRLLGPYDNDQLDELLAPYSIGLVPYKTPHRLTDHVNPDKIYHYLNAGLGVVSTAIPQAMRMQDSLAILRGTDAFSDAAELALLRARNHWQAEDYMWAVRWAEFREYLD